VATGKKPEKPAQARPEGVPEDRFKDAALDQRRDQLADAIAAKQAERKLEAAKSDVNKSDGMAGMAYALKLSSEFIAGILVGIGVGWLIDRLAGTSPWGLIIFLILGFTAGVLNVLRSAGLIAVSKSERGSDYTPSQKDSTPTGNAWPDDKEDE
jgi:ATP synthase protein I